MPDTELHNGAVRTKQTLAIRGSYDIREAAVGGRLVTSICWGSREAGEASRVWLIFCLVVLRLLEEQRAA